MDGATPKTEIGTQEPSIQKLQDEIDVLEQKIRILKNKNKDQTEKLTKCISEKVLLETDNCNKDKVILELKMKLVEIVEHKEAQETRQSSTFTQETQTDRDDLEAHREISYTPISQSLNNDYAHDITNNWHDILIERQPKAEPPGHSNTSLIYVYNATNFMEFYTATPTILSMETDAKIYYHGSNDRNVKNILENGIDVTRSTRATDFSCGDGFYLTKNRFRAAEWSRRVAGWKGGRPAIIAFKISRSLRKEEPHLALKVDTTTNRKWWECVVSHFRQGGRSEDVRNTLKDVKFIKGRVANNKYLGYEEVPTPFGFTQLCIRDQEYAKRFGSLTNIAFVMFDVVA